MFNGKNKYYARYNTQDDSIMRHIITKIKEKQMQNDQEDYGINNVELVGKIIENPTLTHELFGENFFETKIAVARISGHEDIIPITVGERLLSSFPITANQIVCIRGQFRSYNKIEGGKSKLLLSVFVKEIEDEQEGQNSNSIELFGFLCKSPNYRTTPFNREICDLLLAVNRSYNKSDYIPCIAWGRNARYCANNKVGEKIFLSGRIQSREYEKKFDDGSVEKKIALEVSINRITNQEHMSDTIDLLQMDAQ